MLRENDQIHPNASEFQSPHEQYVSVNNVKIYYECANMDQKGNDQPALLFLHGWTANRFRLHPLYIQYVHEDIPVFRFDLRGHGWSQKHGIKDYSLQTMKQDLDQFIQKIII